MQDSHFKLFLPKDRFFNIVTLIRNEEINDLGILPFCSILAKLFHFSPRGFPGGSDGKESTRNVGNLGSIPGSEDPLEEGMATHSSVLAWRILMDRGA